MTEFALSPDPPTKLINGLPVSIWKKQYRRRRMGEIRYYIQERISEWRKKAGPPSDLTVDYLVDLYQQQKGKCYYSGITLFLNARKGHAVPNSISLDRLDPHKGYTQGNVVWCTYFVNTMKGKLTESEFLGLLRQILKTRS
jgi:hypothetical protein